MSNTYDQPKTPLEVAGPPSTLVPIRVDVSSRDKTIRIVDTLLLDPSCWPIPLYAPLQESVERNIRELAYTILSDAEVIGMGRTVRHFTGRVDLWSTELQTKIEDQLREQIWAVVNGRHTLVAASRLASRKNGLLPIVIRLNVHGVVVQEDLQWDPSVPVSPFDFAQELVKDLNLPDDAVGPIAITMLEQIYGLILDVSADESAPAVPTPHAPHPQRRRGAWRMDPKDTVATTAQIVAQHRPV